VLLNHVGHYEYAGDLDKIAIGKRGSMGIIEDTLAQQGAKPEIKAMEAAPGA
jgi:hypothetical protein